MDGISGSLCGQEKMKSKDVVLREDEWIFQVHLRGGEVSGEFFLVQFRDRPTEPSWGGIWEAPKLSGPISPDLTFLGSSCHADVSVTTVCSFCTFFVSWFFSGRRFNLAEQFREALALAWQRALQALEDHQSTSLRFFAGKIAETQKGWKNEVSLSAWKRERRRMRSQRVMKWPGTIGTWVHTDSYGFIWVLCRAGHQIYACLWGCYVMSSNG